MSFLSAFLIVTSRLAHRSLCRWTIALVHFTVIADNCWELASAAPTLSSPICSSESHWSDFFCQLLKKVSMKENDVPLTKTQPCSLYTATLQVMRWSRDLQNV